MQDPDTFTKSNAQLLTLTMQTICLKRNISKNPSQTSEGYAWYSTMEEEFDRMLYYGMRLLLSYSEILFRAGN